MRLAYLILPLLATALLAAPAQAERRGHIQSNHGTGHVEAQRGDGHGGHVERARRHHRPVVRWGHGGRGFVNRGHHRRGHAARMLNPNIVLNQLAHRHWRPFGRIGFHGDRYTVHAHDRFRRPWVLIINGFSGEILHRRRLF